MVAGFVRGSRDFFVGRGFFSRVAGFFAGHQFFVRNVILGLVLNLGHDHAYSHSSWTHVVISQSIRIII